MILYHIFLFSYLNVEFLLEGWGEVCGHLSNGVAGSVADPRVLMAGEKKNNLITVQRFSCSEHESSNRVL